MPAETRHVNVAIVFDRRLQESRELVVRGELLELQILPLRDARLCLEPGDPGDLGGPE